MSSSSVLNRQALASTPTAGRTWRIGLTSVSIALAANLAVYALALLAGAEMTAGAMSINGFLVAANTVVPLLIATLLLLPLRRWGPRGWRVLATIGLALGLLSAPAPFTVASEGSTRFALAFMHVVTGVVWFVVVRRAATRTGA